MLSIEDQATIPPLEYTYFDPASGAGMPAMGWPGHSQLPPGRAPGSRTSNIRANLALARSKTVDQLEEVGSEGLFNQLDHFVQKWLTPDELAIITLSLWLGVALGFIIFSWTKARSVFREGLQYLLIVGSLMLVVGVVSLWGQINLESKQPAGVIVAQQVNVTSGPGSRYVTEFTLHNGAEVMAGETRGNWVRLSLPGGELQGWIPANAVEMVSGWMIFRG